LLLINTLKIFIFFLLSKFKTKCKAEHAFVKYYLVIKKTDAKVRCLFQGKCSAILQLRNNNIQTKN